MLGMVAFVYGQSTRMWHSLQGVSAAWIACMTAFTAINSGLAYRAWRRLPVRPNLLMFVTYALWTVSNVLMLSIILLRLDSLNWGTDDNIATALVTGGLLLTIVIGRSRGLGITDPMVRGIFSAIFRGIPHLALAYKVGLLGGSGLSLLTIFAGHLTSMTRAGQLALAIRASGWDRTRTGLAIAESANIGTWIVVTAVWFLA
jgi:hypothetical protein